MGHPAEPTTYRLHIPGCWLAWHLTFAALHASQALVTRAWRGAAVCGRLPDVSIDTIGP